MSGVFNWMIKSENKNFPILENLAETFESLNRGKWIRVSVP